MQENVGDKHCIKQKKKSKLVKLINLTVNLS